MDHLSRHRAGLALPLGLLGLLGAWMVGDFFGLALLRAEGDARGGLVLLAPTLGATLGWLLSARWVRRRAWRTGLVALFGTGVLGVVIGAYATWLRNPSYDVAKSIHLGGATGATTSLAFLPFVAAIAFLGRHVGRARAGSLVDESDMRSIWALVAFAVAIAAPVVLACGDHAPSFSLATTSSLGLVATLVLVVGFALDVVSARRAKRAAMEVVGMREVSIDSVAIPEVVDLGLGHEAYEELARGGTAYRTNELPIRAILGSPRQASDALGGAVLRTCMLLAFAVLGTVAAQLMSSSV
jgi:hypothetical protein